MGQGGTGVAFLAGAPVSVFELANAAAIGPIAGVDPIGWREAAVGPNQTLDILPGLTEG